MLVSWGPRAVYVGPIFGLPAHRNAVAVLAIGLDGPLAFAYDPEAPAAGFAHCRSALIEPNELHLIEARAGECAFAYVDALGSDFESLRRRCRIQGGPVNRHLEGESEAIELLTRMDRSTAGWAATSTRLEEALGLHTGGRDCRIEQAVQALLEAPASEIGAAGMAARVGLSSSRFQHLFKATTGVPFRRFRLWARMRAALAAAVAGASLTDAALMAGFSSSAHFTSAFKEMFGMAPSQLLAASPLYVEASQRAPGRRAGPHAGLSEAAG